MIFNTGAALLDAIVLSVVAKEEKPVVAAKPATKKAPVKKTKK